MQSAASSHTGPASISAVTVRLWASARAAAGVSEITVRPGTLAGALNEVCAALPGAVGLPPILAVCSYLVDEVPVGSQRREAVLLRSGAVVDVLPPFAGGSTTAACATALALVGNKSGRPSC